MIEQIVRNNLHNVQRTAMRGLQGGEQEAQSNALPCTG